jgi:hypothetical protein
MGRVHFLELATWDIIFQISCAIPPLHSHPTPAAAREARGGWLPFVLLSFAVLPLRVNLCAHLANTANHNNEFHNISNFAPGAEFSQRTASRFFYDVAKSDVHIKTRGHYV